MSDSAFAKHLRDVNQAASISNSCLNPVSNSNTNDNMISNGNCVHSVTARKIRRGFNSYNCTKRKSNNRSATTVDNSTTTINNNKRKLYSMF